jgi:soluble lytic murein transglycosylase
MRARWIRFSPIALVLLAASAAAQDVMALVRADRWAEADAAAAQFADPVARKLVTYYRLLAPNAASTAEIAAFMATSPDWPQQATLARRRDEALADEPDDAVALAQCDQSPPTATAARLHCADAYRAAGRAADAATMLRRAWIDGVGDAAWEAHFLHDYNPPLSRDDQWRRFDRLAWTDTAAATRQAARLDPADRARAEARLAFRNNDPAALTLLAAVPAAQRGDPALVYEQARYLRRAGQDDAALALWASAGSAAERAAPPQRLAAFWDERNILARRRLRVGDAAAAYALASDPAQRSAEQIVDAEFLAGFIALRRLNDPTRATKHFQALAAVSKAAITQGRAHYWLARAAAARGDAAGARAEYATAAEWPSTFYGQLAALALGDTAAALAARIRAVHDPAADATRALDLAGRELARAAAWLVSWGEPGRAQPFLLRLDEVTPDPADQALAARLASGLGLPETAIAIARHAGRDGVILLDTGWPLAAQVPPGVEPALTLGVIRQESSFDTTTISPAGARGLMQLMPATAATVARELGLTPSVPALTLDPGFNMRLGTAYLQDLLDQFGASVPLAVAGYNAGPGHVLEWLGDNGDPSGVGVDVIDWIELIPFGETRNYVQRVIENEVVYRARRGEVLPHPLARWLR